MRKQSTNSRRQHFTFKISRSKHFPSKIRQMWVLQQSMLYIRISQKVSNVTVGPHLPTQTVTVLVDQVCRSNPRFHHHSQERKNVSAHVFFDIPTNLPPQSAPVKLCKPISPLAFFIPIIFTRDQISISR